MALYWQACLRMFLDLDLIGRFHIEYDVLCRWLLSVKKNYRNVIYHNWRHAFNAAQMMFAIVTVRSVKSIYLTCLYRDLWRVLCYIVYIFKGTQWWKKLGEIEVLGLIMACLCHDLDHRGTNNSFQIKYAWFVYQQLLSTNFADIFQGILSSSSVVYYVYYGTSPFWSVSNDFE